MATKIEQDAVRDRLQQLTDANGGRLTPDAVVADARDAKSPLHGYFEWSDKKAAEAHRLDQARTLIRSVTVVVTHERTVISAPFYVRDPDAGTDQGYIALRSVRAESEIAREVAADEFARARHGLRRAQNVGKVLGIDAQVQSVIDELELLTARLGAEAPVPTKSKRAKA